MEGKKVEVPDKLIKKLILRHDFFSKAILKEARRWQKKQQNEGEEVSLVEALFSCSLIPPEKKQEFILFLEFFRQRIEGAICCQLAIQQEWLTASQYRAVLITQRSLFLLTNKVLPLLDLLVIKGQLNAKIQKSVYQKYRNLSSEEFEQMWHKTLHYIDEEDKQTQEWREAHLQGKLGIKYKESEPPPIATKHKEQGGETFSQEETLELAHKDLPKAREVVPTKPPSKLESETSPLVHGDMTEMIVIPRQQHSRRISTGKKAIVIVAGMLLVFLALALWLNRGQARTEYNVLVTLLQQKEWRQAEEFARNFVVTYPESELTEQVKRHLQGILYRKAEIALEQEQLQLAKENLEEAQRFTGEKTHQASIENLYQQVLQQITRERYRQEFHKQAGEIKKLLQQQQLLKAQRQWRIVQGEFSALPWLKEDLQQLSGEISQQKAQLLPQLYRFVPAKQLSLSPLVSQPLATQASSLLSVKQLALDHSLVVSKQKESLQGHFFDVVHGYLHRIDPNNGKSTWVQNIGDHDFVPLFLAGPKEHFNMERVDKVLAVSTWNNSLLLLNAESGDMIWECPLPALVSAQPTLHKGKVYVGCMDRRCYQVDIASGEIDGAYQSGDVPLFAPVFDRRHNKHYLVCRNYTYVYDSSSQQLLFRLPHQGPPSANCVVVAPYLFMFRSQENKTHILLYLSKQEGEPELLKEMTLPGKMVSPAVLSFGILAVPTDSYLGVYGVNPATPKQAIFSLSGISPIYLGSSGQAHLQFANFGQQILVAQGSPAFYSIEGFTESNAIGKIWEQEEGQKWQTYLPIQKLKDVYFIANRQEERFAAMAFRTNKQQAEILWYQERGLAIKSELAATDDKRLLFSTSNHSLHEIYLTPEQQISYRSLNQNASDGTSSPLFVATKQCFVTLYNNSPLLFDAVTGWQMANWPQFEVRGKLAQLAWGQETVFVAGEKGVFALDFEQGSKKFLEYSEFRGAPFYGTPVYQQQKLYLGCDNGNFYQLQLNDKQSIPFLARGWVFASEGKVRSTPLWHEQTLYFGSDDGKLYALDSKQGKLLWSFATKGAVRAQPVVVGDKILITSADQQIYCLQREQGKLLWQQQLSGEAASPLVKGEEVFVAASSGDFYLLALENGQVQEKIFLGGALYSSPVALGEKIFLGAANGFVYVIEIEKGADEANGN